MRRVLLVCYYFPPMSGAGVTRPLALFRHLPEYDWECHVLTVKPVAYRAFEPELLEGLPEERIYRAGSTDPQRLMYLMGLRTVADRVIRRGRGMSDWYFPDPKVGWVRRAVALGRTLLANRDYDAILSTSPPISSHLVARKLSREFRRPWIADFRDYWAIRPDRPEEQYAEQPGRLRRVKRLLGAIRTDATEVTAVNETVGEYVRANSVIYNCYDENVAAGWKLPSGKEFVIGVLGTLNEVTPVAPLLRILDRLRREQPELFARVKVVQVGETDLEWIRDQIDGYGMGERFELYGWRSRRETVEILSEASVLYLGVASEAERGLSTGRVYTMLASGRPILAWAPEVSELAQLIAYTGSGRSFFGEDGSSAAGYLSELIRAHDEGLTVVTLDPAYAKEFSSGAMTEQFAGLLDRQEVRGYR